jgi:hypothetical protein
MDLNTDYNNPPSVISFMSGISSTSGRLHSEFIRLLFLQVHRETDRFFKTSGVQFPEQNRGLFHKIDGSPITSRTHTHPSHSETSRILTSSLSLGVPVPRSNQCM